MTNAQKWVLLFFVLFIAFLVITYISNKEEETYSNNNPETVVENDNDVSGLSIYKSAGCSSCHGEQFAGTENGPALFKLSENWSKTELVNFLRNPNDFSKDERITKYKEKFGNAFMPSYNTIDAKKLGKLAEYLLSK